MVPDLVDAAVIAVAHFVMDGFGRLSATLAADDLALLAARGVTAAALAVRLAEHGLRRVGCVAFAELARRDSSWGSFREAVTRRPAEQRQADWFVDTIHALAGHSPYAAFMVIRSIGDTVPRAAGSLAMAAARGVRDRLRPLIRV